MIASDFAVSEATLLGLVRSDGREREGVFIYLWVICDEIYNKN
jgi:hypothetical protein